jgi:Putative adhesin
MKKKLIFGLCILLIFAGLYIFIFLLNDKNNEKGVMSMTSDKKSFKNINVKVKLRNVEFIISGDRAYEYEVYDKSYSKIIHEIKGSTLTITEKINYFLMFNYIIDLLRGLNRFDIKIYFPKGSEFDAVNLKNTIGSASVNEINCKMLELDSTSGNLSVASCIAENFKARQTSGKLNIDGCMIGNTLDINSTSGCISVAASSIDNLKIKKTSGRIKINGTKIGYGEINKTSGNLEIKDTDTRGLKISTTSGNTVFTGILAGKSDIKSTSGSIMLDIASKKQNYNIYADVLSGYIYIDGKKQNCQKEKQYNKSENGQNELRLKTTSGYIRVAFH